MEEKHLPLFRDIHSELFSDIEREFFKCRCHHLVIEHEESGKCRRPNCPCINFNGARSLRFPRGKVIDAKYWKACAEFMREFKFKEKIC